MKLKAVHIKNFRCYKDISVDFDDLTTFIGKNDIGKSTILEALEIYFNNELVKIDQGDLNKDAQKSGDNLVEITCDFCDLPSELKEDPEDKNGLRLQDEYLTLDVDGQQILRFKKVYDCSKIRISPKEIFVAKHPTAEGFDNLLTLKESELQALVRELHINVPLKGNAAMRKAIWESATDLKLQVTDVEASSSILELIKAHLPYYALFQSDRGSYDSDGEVQSPMRFAVQQAFKEVQPQLDAIEKQIRQKVEEITGDTLKALKDMGINLTSELNPDFSLPTAAKLGSLFPVSIKTENGIDLNRHGTGLRRIVLVGFFKAEAQRRLLEEEKSNIIYAVEEPETSQHPNNQKILINALKDLAESENCQVILTTHSPGLAGELPVDCLRFIDRDSNGMPTITRARQGNKDAKNGEGKEILSLIADALGIYAKPGVKVVLCVEGPTDVVAMRAFSRCLREKYPEVVDLDNDPRIMIVPLGGGTLKFWVDRRYLKNLNCPEVHIYDSDVGHYQKSIDRVIARGDGSWGTLTHKYEIENYLHSKAIEAHFKGIVVDTDADDVPKQFADACKKIYKRDVKAKQELSKVFEIDMTYDLLAERDPEGEVKGWFDRIKALLD